jgi:hypothetical protein
LIEAAYYRANDTEDDVQQQAFAGLFDGLAADESRREARITQAKRVMFECVDPAAATIGLGPRAGTMSKRL